MGEPSALSRPRSGSNGSVARRWPRPVPAWPPAFASGRSLARSAAGFFGSGRRRNEATHRERGDVRVRSRFSLSSASSGRDWSPSAAKGCGSEGGDVGKRLVPFREVESRFGRGGRSGRASVFDGCHGLRKRQKGPRNCRRFSPPVAISSARIRNECRAMIGSRDGDREIAIRQREVTANADPISGELVCELRPADPG